ncbi:MAG: phospholipase D family protein [Nitrososphaeria archaeon]|nr:phospholipase D family protein [Nitrososphaeria archaeon]
MVKLKALTVVTFFAIGLLLGGIITSNYIRPEAAITKTLSTTVTQLETWTTISQVTITVTKTVVETVSPTEVLGIYFSPKGGCAEQIIYWINRANTSIHVLIYSFTLQNIADALIDAKNRGVDVKVVFEKSQISQYSQYFTLANAGISVRNDTNPDYMHNKVAIIDGIIVLTGSYNWSSSAENSNNENLIIIKSVDVAREYENVFIRIWEHGR